MEGFEKILVPVDFSETSFNALETAVLLAKRNNASLDIIYARDTIPELVLVENHKSRIKENSQAIMHAYVNAIEHKHNIKPKLIWEEGLPADAIIRTANKNKPDLIVCGTHGASGYRESFIGSTAYTVIKYATCPVLTIPSGPRWLNFSRLLLPVRPIHGALKQYDVLLKVASKTTYLEILDLSNSNSEDDAQLVTYIVDELKDKLNGHSIETNLSKANGSNIADSILNKIGRVKYDVIILTPSIDMTNKQLFIGPYTQKILNQSPIPVLVIKRN
jgi:nucleotide-binding universal stress UspA family protein